MHSASGAALGVPKSFSLGTKRGHSVNVFKNIKWHMKMLCSYHLICHFYYQFFLSDLKSSPFGHDVPEEAWDFF